MKIKFLFFVCLIITSISLNSIIAQEIIRVATYNIKFLNTEVNSERLGNLKKVIDILDADIIGLQEIDNREALEQLFPPNDWHIIIDDDSGQNQDVAIVAKKRFEVLGFAGNNYNANDEHFLFPDPADDVGFPRKRDVLCVEIKMPNDNYKFYLMVVHSLSRMKGRETSNPRRVEAAKKLIHKIETEFDENDFIILGDFNDNPDDQALNILESGSQYTEASMENIKGRFMINLTESLIIDGHVSHGRNTSDLISPDRTMINTIDPESRIRNYINLSTDKNTGDILFDQILIPTHMESRYIPESVKVYNDASGVVRNSDTRASDHLPVFADFLMGEEEEFITGSEIMIISLLPDPDGKDMGNEEISLKNISGNIVDLTGWYFRDKNDNKVSITISLSPNEVETIKLPGMQMPLNNDGDIIYLHKSDGTIVNQVQYSNSEVKKGRLIVF